MAFDVRSRLLAARERTLLKDRRRIPALIVVMASVSLAVVGLTLYLLYGAAFEQQKAPAFQVPARKRANARSDDAGWEEF